MPLEPMEGVDTSILPPTTTEIVVIEIESEDTPFIVCECVPVLNHSVFFWECVLCADFDGARQIPSSTVALNNSFISDASALKVANEGFFATL